MNVSGHMTFDEAELSRSAAHRDKPATSAIVVGPAAGNVRRALGPVAWCALEYLAASPCPADTVIGTPSLPPCGRSQPDFG